jgi:hypothetical protein
MVKVKNQGASRKICRSWLGLLLLTAPLSMTGCSSSLPPEGYSRDQYSSTGTTGLTLTPAATTITPGANVTIGISGGNGIYTTATATTGTVTASTATSFIYTAPTSASVGTGIVITASDSAGATGTTTLTIGSATGGALTLNPLSPTLATGAQTTFTVSGGQSPYNWQISGGGSLSASTGQSVTFTAPSSSANVTIQVVDGSGTSATTTIVVGNGTSSTNGTWVYIGQLTAQSLGIAYCGSEGPSTCSAKGTLCYIMAGSWYDRSVSATKYNVYACH